MATTENTNTREQLREILSRRIMILDGSMGALIYSYQLGEDDVRGERFARHDLGIKNCTEALVLTQPKIIEDIHRAYLEAGADIIETDTFNGTAVSLEEFGLQEHVFEINKTAAELARRVADEFTRKNPDKPRFVAGSIGPTKKQLSMGIHVDDPGRRDTTFDEMVASYLEQIRALAAGGVDILLSETSFDTLVMKACLFAMDRFFEETGTRLPVMISGTIFDNGRTLSAQPIEAFYYSVSHFDALSVGLNCAVGVDLMRDSIESLSPICRSHVSCYPNAGMPDGFGGFLGDKDHTAAVLGEFARNGWLNIVGGCCGTTPEWIAAIARAVEGVPPRPIPNLPHWSNYSGMEPLVIRPETNFIMIGERTNITGSKKFARLIKTRRLRGRAGGGTRSGRGGRQYPRRQHGRGPDRRRAGDDPVLEPDLDRREHRQDPDDGRQLQVERHRGGAQVRPGQVRRQLDQLEGGRRRVSPPGAAGPKVWGRRRGHGIRRAGPGCHQGKQAGNLPACLQATYRASRLSAGRHHLRRQYPHGRHRHRRAQ